MTKEGTNNALRLVQLGRERLIKEKDYEIDNGGGIPRQGFGGDY